MSGAVDEHLEHGDAEGADHPASHASDAPSGAPPTITGSPPLVLPGPVPPETGTIPRLVRFKMQGNHLTGPIPDTFGDLKALEWIRVFGASLWGGKGCAGGGLLGKA